MQQVDFIIVGQGLAGSLLAFQFINQGCNILVVDPCKESTSSIVAAGITHPITGRRIVKTWKADMLIPFANQSYQDLEKRTFSEFHYKAPVIELYHSVQHRNEWMARSSDDSVKKYIGREIEKNQLPQIIRHDFGGIEIKETSWLDVKKFIGVMKSYFEGKNSFVNDEVNFNEVQLTDNGVLWKSYKASKIIFCNGYFPESISCFASLPFIPAKGELLEFTCDELKIDYILSKGIYIVPLGNGKFKAGATYAWNDFTPTPTAQGLNYLTDAVKKIINSPVKITNHLAAIRPTTKDRRPFIGLHKTFNQVGIFNGMGTKGVSIAPYYASQFVNHLLNNSVLDDEVNINRFG